MILQRMNYSTCVIFILKQKQALRIILKERFQTFPLENLPLHYARIVEALLVEGGEVCWEIAGFASYKFSNYKSALYIKESTCS